VVDIKGIHLTAVASGDSVLLTLARRAGQKFHQLLTINLDADLLAETGLNSKNQQGLSERTESVTPMIERFRASAADAGVWAVVDGERVSTLR
jgi:protein required for attachment to host cells